MKKRMFAVSAAALAAGFLVMTAPQAAHAVNAAIVQVVSSAAAPVFTQPINQSPSQLVLLKTPSSASLSAGAHVNMLLVDPATGTIPGDFLVPAGQRLVITDMMVTSFNNTPADVWLTHHITNASQEILELYTTTPGTVAHHLVSGIVFLPGNPVIVRCDAGAGVNVTLHGYLTAN